MSRKRNFHKLIGKTIVSVDTSVVNEVILMCSDLNLYVIQADDNLTSTGIPVITLKKVKLEKGVKDKGAHSKKKDAPAKLLFLSKEDNSLD
jgi:hypothetical protein